MSFNMKDFVILHNEYAVSRRDHWGIIVSRQIPVGEVMRKLLRFLTDHSRDSAINRLFFLG